MKMKFWVHEEGDHSVGIWDYDAEITIEDNRKEWTEDDIRSFKGFIVPALNCEEGTATVLTDEERNKIIEEEEKWMRERQEEAEKSTDK